MSPLDSLVSLPTPTVCDPFPLFIEHLLWGSHCVQGTREEVGSAADVWFRSGRSRQN